MYKVRNMERPKFCAGEAVEVAGVVTSEYNTDKTEVVSVKYFSSAKSVNGDISGPGWRYQTAHQPDKKLWWREASLKKLPPNKRVSFSDTHFQPMPESITQ